MIFWGIEDKKGKIYMNEAGYPALWVLKKDVVKEIKRCKIPGERPVKVKVERVEGESDE